MNNVKDFLNRYVAAYGNASVRIDGQADVSGVNGVTVVKGEKEKADIYIASNSPIDSDAVSDASVVVYEADQVSFRPDRDPEGRMSTRPGWQQNVINSQLVVYTRDGVVDFQLLDQDQSTVSESVTTTIPPEPVEPEPVEPPAEEPSVSFSIEGSEPPQEDEEDEDSNPNVW